MIFKASPIPPQWGRANQLVAFLAEKNEVLKRFALNFQSSTFNCETIGF
jgi:hypothetical protein